MQDCMGNMVESGECAGFINATREETLRNIKTLQIGDLVCLKNGTIIEITVGQLIKKDIPLMRKNLYFGIIKANCSCIVVIYKN